MKLENKQNSKETKVELIYYFASIWRDFETTGVYKLHACTVNDKNKFTFVGVLVEDKSAINGIYYLKGFCKDKFIELNKQRKFKKEVFVFIPHDGIYILYIILTIYGD